MEGKGWTDEVRKAFKRPFPKGAVKWKAQATSSDKTRALAVAFIDARNVMERLDRVVGPGEWGDEYEVVIATGEEFVVECRLTVLGVTKADVGDSSASGGGGNLAKTAYSDALKRAAVKFGVGRYLYALPKRWVTYDAQHKRLAEEPQLPSWAIPGDEDDLGEDAPFEEQAVEEVTKPQAEAPLKPREEKAAVTATVNPGQYILDYGKKHKGKTLAAIQAEDANYLAWVADTSNAKPPVKLAVKVFLAWGEQRKGQVAAANAPANAQPAMDGMHWSTDEKTRKRFFGSVHNLKVKDGEMRILLVGSEDGHLADYIGSVGDALTLIREWAVEQGRIAR
ncbi:MAG TPA: Rad52/Rad22 family DNA repair protein [Anaerolineae bacterium]|nr:Rad52/Rad22 family DNA repair protein [Anaerolineae bacterium]